MSAASPPETLVVVLGDQLDLASAAFDGFDPVRDAVFMAEVAEESTHVWSHRARIALFLSAMRHFRDAIDARGWTVHYEQLDEDRPARSLADALSDRVRELRPGRLVMTEAGDWRVHDSLTRAAAALGVELEIRNDRHFLCTRDEFARHASGRRQLRMEFFYREMRRRTGVLMDGREPRGGAWNYDAENRGSFGRGGPGEVPKPVAFPPDAVTREVLALVARRFADHPGGLDRFDWPVTRDEALTALRDFVAHRLPHFGQYQDAMWSSADHADRDLMPPPATRDAILYHSRLSAALNLKLLDPREVIAAAEEALEGGHAPLASVEGFIRQILGWREYVRGIYWHLMPEYLHQNALDATLPLPDFYWTGDTDMNCLRRVIGQTLEFGYAHHIQRLMVTGLYALLLGVRPQEVHAWYLAVFVDAVEWVELPNTLGMSQHGDGGLMASKPYVATGKYIQRMSNYCTSCRFDPARSTGEGACPFTTLYWDFLMRHESRLTGNPRMALQVRNLRRLSGAEREALQARAALLRAAPDAPPATGTA